MAGVRIKIRLNSTGTKKNGKKTGYFITTTKNPRTMTEKLVLRRFDPHAWNPKTEKCGMYVEFKEGKIK